MQGIKTVVTGGAGFIGSHVAELLIQSGAEVAIIDDLSAGKKENVPQGATLHELDIRDTEAIEKVCSGATYLFHLAANPRVQDSIENPLGTADINVRGTLSILTAAKKAGVLRVVFASSAAVYGDIAQMPLQEDMNVSPISPYGLHKYEGEHYLRLWSFLYGLETVSLRYFNVYGKRSDPKGAYPLVIGFFLERLKEGKTLPVTGDGTHTRDYVHVSDIARANLLAATSEKVGKGEVFNIGSGLETSVIEIAKLMKGDIEYVPERIEPARSVADATRAKQMLGWEPQVSLERGIAELLV